MILEEIMIESFRSINNQCIKLDFKCKGLIGLNESGKSNILDAIRGLDEDFKFSMRDKSKINDKFPTVIYKFKFEEHDINEIKTTVQKRLKPLLEISNTSIFKKFILDDLTINVSSKLENNILETIRDINYNEEIEFIKEYVFIPETSSIPVNTLVKIKEKPFILKNYQLINKEHLTEEFNNLYISTADEVFKSKFYGLLETAIWVQIPSIIFWEYNDKYLLPSEITYENLMKEDLPYENSAPLYNMFLLSERLGIYDENILSNRISQWKLDSSLRRKEASILSDDINKYIKSIWEDYDQELNIELEESKITIHINDPKSSQKNYYEMEARSQGFKTFISFILTIGAEFENRTIDNFILLLDEPETHLHPSGVRFMRNELLKLSEDGNYVIFATHSVFMIDRKNLTRHYIVSKENEITKLKPVERNNITQEAVIYETLGTTIDEFSISNKNIMFEGDLDLLLFDFFINQCLAKKDNHLLDYCLLNGGGTRRIEDFFSNKIIPKDSEWILILDNDNPGQKLKDSLNKKIVIKNYLVNFYFYSETSNYEIEDILIKSVIIKSVNDTLKKINIDIDFSIEESDKRPFSSIITEFYCRNKIQKNDFEGFFKDTLYKVIDRILKDIGKEKSIGKRFQSFCQHFPLYYTFIEAILRDKKIQGINVK